MSSINDARGKPRQYKGLSLHPVKIKEVQEFYWAVECLALEKSASTNLKVLRMSYLDFLITLMMEYEDLKFELNFTPNDLKMKFSLLCELVFKVENIEFRQTEFNTFELIFDNTITINGQEFDEIKKIIAEQNAIDLTDKFVNPEVRKKMKETREFIRKQNQGKSAPLDQQIIAYHCASGLSYDAIDELTIYQFNKGLARFNHMIHAQYVNQGIYAGTISMEKNKSAPSWLDLIKDVDIDDQLKINSDTFINGLGEKGLVN